MSKKDYQLIAAVIQPYANRLYEIRAQDMEKAVETMAIMLSDAFRHDDPRFDKDKFLKACGF